MKTNKLAAKTWTLRIQALEEEMSRTRRTRPDCPSLRAMDRDLDLAWRRKREAEGLRA